jgi:hypothetical protein
VDGKGEFDENILALGNNFKIEYEQFFETYNEGQCVMVSIKKCDNNIKRILISENTMLHNFNKGR